VRFYVIAALVVTAACDGDLSVERGRYVLDAYRTATTCDDSFATAATEIGAFELHDIDGMLSLETCLTATDCNGFIPGGTSFGAGPFEADGDALVSITATFRPDVSEGNPNPPPPSTCTLGYAATRITAGGAGTLHVQHEHAERSVSIDDCNRGSALALAGTGSCAVLDGHLVQRAPVIDRVEPASIASAACTTTPLEISGDSFLPRAVVAIPTTTGQCSDGSYGYAYEGLQYCPIVIDAITPTSITAHFAECPAVGPVPLLVMNGDADFDASGRAITYGQMTAFEGFAITP
jgi:hypothetical protein